MVVKLLRIVSELTSVHEDFPKRMPEGLCTWQSRESVKLMVDEVQILLWTFNPPFARVRIPPYVIITYRQWFGKPETAKAKTVHFMCARTFLDEQLLRLTWIYSVAAVHFLPCPKTDTVMRTFKPKESFPLGLLLYLSIRPFDLYERL